MESSPGFELVTLRSGTISLRCLERKETFHPGTGPMLEANILHVQQQRLVERCREEGGLVLWDVGLGAAANALAAVEALKDSPHPVAIHSFDITTAPLLFALENADSLVYPAPYRHALGELLAKGETKIGKLQWRFHRGDFRLLMQNPALPSPGAIFYDPYSPVGNQEMWTLSHFRALHARLDPAQPCLLTNYTRSTAVRVTLLLAGFYVGVGCVIGEKAETSVASNRLESLERPLGREWLERVKISRNGAPMHDDAYRITPISAEDFAALERHPQFTA